MLLWLQDSADIGVVHPRDPACYQSAASRHVGDAIPAAM